MQVHPGPHPSFLPSSLLPLLLAASGDARARKDAQVSGVGWDGCKATVAARDRRAVSPGGYECGIFGDLQGPLYVGTPCTLPFSNSFSTPASFGGLCLHLSPAAEDIGQLVGAGPAPLSQTCHSLPESLSEPHHLARPEGVTSPRPQGGKERTQPPPQGDSTPSNSLEECKELS